MEDNVSKPSAEELVEQAEGRMKSKHLTKTGGIIDTYLYTHPLIEYLGPNEQPEYYFKNYNKGLKIKNSSNSQPETPHHTGTEGGRYLLVTNQRILYVAGRPDGDEMREFAYGELCSVETSSTLGHYMIKFEDTQGATYYYAPDKYNNQIPDAADYVQQKIGEKLGNIRKIIEEGHTNFKEAEERYKQDMLTEAKNKFDESIERYEKACEIGEFRETANKEDIKEQLEQARQRRKDIQFTIHSREGKSHYTRAENLAKEGNLKKSVEEYERAIQAYDQAAEVNTSSQLNKKNNIKSRIREAKSRKEELQLSFLGQRTADIDIPEPNDSANIDPDIERLINELEDILSYAENNDISRAEDLDIIREEAVSKLVQARIIEASKDISDGIREFQSENYGEARDIFINIEDDLRRLRDDAEKLDATEFIDQIERIASICKDNSNVARRASLGLDSSTSVNSSITGGEEIQNIIFEQELSEQSSSNTQKQNFDNLISTQSKTDSVDLAELGGSLEYDDIVKERRIGSGGNADVHQATITLDDEKCTIALKEPRIDDTLLTDLTEKFISEADTWSKLDDHENIVSVIDYGGSPLPWIGLEYMEAGDLNTTVENMDMDEKFKTAISIIDAVWHAHQRGVAHLDLKPANILFTEKEEKTIAKVADWGLAKMLLNNSETVEGLSPRYSAPEQFDSDTYGAPDNSTDIYQTGTILYEIFANRHPFSGPPMEVMQSVLNEEPDPPSKFNDNLPPKIDNIILKSLSKQKEDRHETIVYLRDALQRSAP